MKIFYEHNVINKNHNEILYSGSTDAELLGDVVHQIFFENKDLNLLFVLLASASGIANAFHLMTLFDEDFRYFDFTRMTNMQSYDYANAARYFSFISSNNTTNYREEMEVGGIDIRGSTIKKYAVDVRVRDEHSLLKAALKSLPGVDIMYTIEINPSLLKNSVFALPVKPLSELPIGKNNQTMRNE